MISIALFPCSFIDGATLVGELSMQLGLMVYTDGLLLDDIVREHGGSAERMREVLFGRKPPADRATLEKERMVNHLRRHLVARLRQEQGRTLFYGRLASLFTPALSSVFRVLVIDSEEARMVRAMKQEGCTAGQARRMISRHDSDVSLWTDYLHGRMAYDPVLYDAVIAYNERDVFTVTNDVIAGYIQREGVKTQETITDELRNQAVSLEVERALLEDGFQAKVKVGNGRVHLQVSSSSYHFSWLSKALAKRALTVSGVEQVTISNDAGILVCPEESRQDWLPGHAYA
ncbi:MAG: cytidylate kinase family protein [Desulfofustis sp.]|jgi:hypothetical protein|nr:cytidylate kinase family protein [Desulfofustis sp.]